jgi:hypothetical protein
MVGVELARKASFHEPEKPEHHQSADRADDGRKPKAYADKYANGGRDPDRSRRRETSHRQAFLEDDTSTKEADAGHDPLCHSCRIGANGIVLD